MNTLLILHADHEQNCSTSTVRIVGSSYAGLYASISAGIGALWGRLHGGANQAVIEMLELIKKIAKNKKLLVLMVTHEPADAKKVASQTLVVKDKKVNPPLSTEKALYQINGQLADYLLNQ